MATKTPTRGILLIGLGDPNYGNMATNLAATIRVSDPDIPIHLVWHGRSIGHLSDKHKALFTSMSECPEEAITYDGKIEYIGAKTWMYDLSPFDETLFLDADIFSIPKIPVAPLLDKLSDACDFTIQNRGYANLSKPDSELNPNYATWCNILEVKKHFKTEGRFYHLHSEFVFFKKNAGNKKFFQKVKQIYKSRPIPWQVFDGGVPDEYAFDIAMAITGHYPHEDNALWVYWHAMRSKQLAWNSIVDQYGFVSLGGKDIPPFYIAKGNLYMDYCRRALDLPCLFPILPKRNWNKKRTSI